MYILNKWYHNHITKMQRADNTDGDIMLWLTENPSQSTPAIRIQLNERHIQQDLARNKVLNRNQ